MNIAALQNSVIHSAERVFLTSVGFLEAHPHVCWTLAILVSIRLLIALFYLCAFRRLNLPGTPRWPRLLVCRKAYWIHCPRYLTPWRYWFVSRSSTVAEKLSRFLILVLMVSFIPLPAISQFFSHEVRGALVAIMVSAWIVDRTQWHRVLGALTLGATTDIFLTRRFLIVLRFFGAIMPLVRCHRRDPALGLTATLELHEQAPEERNINVVARPVFSDSWHVILRLGQRPVRVATVFGKLQAEHLANGFAALREQLNKDRGVHKRAMAEGAWAFGRTQPRAE